MSLVTIHCPHCGRELNIPDDAGNIVCMFCAEPIDVRSILAPPEPAVDDAAPPDWDALLPDGLFSDRLSGGNFNVRDYPAEYERYSEQFQPALRAFLRSVQNDPGAADEFAERLFRRFRDSLQRAGGKRRDSFPVRLTITALMIPSLLSLPGGEGERAADCFLAKWNGAFPKEPLGKATYEQVLGGFRHKLCYITTAVCRSLGKGDDCGELNAFRSFRDGWLSRAPGGREKIAEYYLFAPMVVRAIDASDRAETEYLRIWEDGLSPLLRCLREGRQTDCAAGYEKMVRSLEEKWLS